MAWDWNIKNCHLHGRRCAQRQFQSRHRYWMRSLHQVRCNRQYNLGSVNVLRDEAQWPSRKEDSIIRSMLTFQQIWSISLQSHALNCLNQRKPYHEALSQKKCLCLSGESLSNLECTWYARRPDPACRQQLDYYPLTAFDLRIEYSQDTPRIINCNTLWLSLVHLLQICLRKSDAEPFPLLTARLSTMIGILSSWVAITIILTSTVLAQIPPTIDHKAVSPCAVRLNGFSMFWDLTINSR